jgi:two-component system response regulator HydG
MSERREDGEVSTVLRAAPRARATPCFALEVVQGLELGHALSLDESRAARALIGTGPACDVRLTDPLVSRRHAAVDVSGDELRLVDLGSSNGTFVNGCRVKEAYLRGGELVQLGETCVRVALLEAAANIVLSGATSFGRLVGSSVEMRRLYPLCERLAQGAVPVLLEGETGTGKELLAEAIHGASPRSSGPFIVFDCTAVPATLVESELFGHERGAFTGAVSARKGVFEQAHGGTLFIDEIGDLDIALQPRLLRALQESSVRRVGGDKWIQVDVRVLAATRRNLDLEVQAGRFRDDLFFRLAVARIELPPLRERRGEVAVLAHHFWKTLGASGALPYELLRRYEEYAWPGNVRELYNEVARRITMGDTELPARRMTQPPSASAEGPPSSINFIDDVIAQALPFPRARDRVQEEFLRRYVEHALARHGGSVARAAAASGIALRYFQQLRARGGGSK